MQGEVHIGMAVEGPAVTGGRWEGRRRKEWPSGMQGALHATALLCADLELHTRRQLCRFGGHGARARFQKSYR